MKSKNSGWWEDFFPAFQPLFGLVKPATTQKQVRFLIKKLRLKKGSTFLDCPCGTGRISIPMARAGIRVTGVDITQQYLTELETVSSRRKLNLRLFQNDMRRIDFKNEFDAGGNLWTSFGFFEKEADNLRVLKQMFAALKPSRLLKKAPVRWFLEPGATKETPKYLRLITANLLRLPYKDPKKCFSTTC